MKQPRIDVYCRKSPLSESDAWRVAKKFRSQGDPDVHAYHCSECSFWHVGFDRQSRRRRALHA